MYIGTATVIPHATIALLLTRRARADGRLMTVLMPAAVLVIIILRSDGGRV